MHLGRYSELRKRLADIRARLSGLTAGRWDAGDGWVTTSQVDPQHVDDAIYYGGGMVCESVKRADAEMIAHAPDDLTFLLSLCEGLLREKQRLDAAIARLEVGAPFYARELLDFDLRAAGIEPFTINAGYLPRAGGA